jgi:hypothetical protein
MRCRAAKKGDEFAPSHVLPQDRGPHSPQRILPKMANRGQGGVTYFAVGRETYGMPAPGAQKTASPAAGGSFTEVLRTTCARGEFVSP